MTLYPGYKCDNIRIGDYRIEYIDKSWNNLLSWMILQRGRLRSKLKPFGFDPQEVHTARGNRLAIREAFLIHMYSVWPSGQLWTTWKINDVSAGNISEASWEGYVVIEVPFL